MKRIYFLDGIRGWAAIIVMLYHFWVNGFPITQNSATMLKKLFLFNGELAVYVFFIASGFSLTIAYFNKFDPLVLKKILIGRYFRLIIPIGVISFICFIMMQLGLVPPLDLRPALFREFLQNTPTFIHFAKFHLFQVLYHYQQNDSLIPPLWTMQYEFIGSCFLICSLLLAHRIRPYYKLFFLLIISSLLIRKNFFYSLFFIGAALAWLYSNYPIKTETKNTNSRGLCFFFTSIISSWFFNYFDEFTRFSHIYQSACLICFFISVMYCKSIQSFLSSRLSVYLGKISFPLYLIHSVVIWTIGLNLIGRVDTWVSNCICIVIALIAAHLLTFFDTIAIMTSRKIGALVFRSRMYHAVEA